MDLGFAAVGRPSCCGGLTHVVDLVKRVKPEHVVIVADRDGPGEQGARKLASVLVAYVPALRSIVQPAKDARDWVRSGATKTEVEAAIDVTDPTRLKIRVLSKQREGTFVSQT